MLIDSPLAEESESALLKAFVRDDTDSLPPLDRLPVVLDTPTDGDDTEHSTTSARQEPR
ncbi:hypothetical protein [Sediminihabitans luteus]|nr:hypothetical protein [Sediminihabitans luteus]